MREEPAEGGFPEINQALILGSEVVRNGDSEEAHKQLKQELLLMATKMFSHLVDLQRDIDTHTHHTRLEQ